MKCAETLELETPVIVRRDPVRMPKGLLGFAKIKDFRLTNEPDEHPSAALQLQVDTGLACVGLDPFLALLGDQPDHLQAADDAPRATVNVTGLVNIRNLWMITFSTSYAA